MLNKIVMGAALAALLLFGCDLTGRVAQTADVLTLSVDQELGESIAGILPGETRVVRVDALGDELAQFVRAAVTEQGMSQPETVVMAIEDDSAPTRGTARSCRSSSIGCGHSPDCSGSSYVVRATKVMTPLGPCTHEGYKYLAPVTRLLYGCTDPDCEYWRDVARQYHYMK